VPGRWPELGLGHVHVWLADLSAWAPELERCRAVLSPDEQERAARFRFPEHRARQVLTRGLLRFLLARYTGTNAKELLLSSNPHGKPSIVESGIRFNLSHAGAFAAYSFSRAAEVGIDIECVRPQMPRQREIAERFFAPGEFASMANADDKDFAQMFFRCWTRKEAFVKARGDGIAGGLQTFEVSVTEDARVIRAEADGLRWCMAELPPIAGMMGAVAVAAEGCVFSFQKLEPWLISDQLMATNA
jgi:4'-phosphopantetheinyl transferase